MSKSPKLHIPEIPLLARAVESLVKRSPEIWPGEPERAFKIAYDALNFGLLQACTPGTEIQMSAALAAIFTESLREAGRALVIQRRRSGEMPLLVDQKGKPIQRRRVN